MKYLKYLILFVMGFIMAYLICQNKGKKTEHQESKIILSQIKNISKLVVTKSYFSEVFSFTDSQKYLYDLLSFDKKAILLVNANIEVGYNLSSLNVQVDSVAKQIIINKIPTEEITVIPSIKYFDLQQSNFNSFSKEELNTLNTRAIEKIKKSPKIEDLKKKSKQQLFKELSKLFILSKTFGWKVVNNTPFSIEESFSKEFKN